jgi:hypothetical protein
MSSGESIRPIAGGLAKTATGLIFEYLDEDEADFLYEEIFER